METINYQCPACGGTMHFDVATSSLECDFCQSHFTVEQVESVFAASEKAAIQSHDDKNAKQRASKLNDLKEAPVAPVAKVNRKDVASEYAKSLAWEQSEEGRQANLRSFVCESCSAELMASNGQIITQCPYCGNTGLAPTAAKGMARPDYVIPFSQTKDQAVASLKKYYEGKRLLPKKFIEAC